MAPSGRLTVGEEVVQAAAGLRSDRPAFLGHLSHVYAAQGHARVVGRCPERERERERVDDGPRPGRSAAVLGGQVAGRDERHHAEVAAVVRQRVIVGGYLGGGLHDRGHRHRRLDADGGQ